MMSSSHSPPCEIQSDRSITMFSKNTTRVFRRRRREKKVSVASEETEREKETFERRRGNFFSRRPPPKEPAGGKIRFHRHHSRIGKQNERERNFFVFDAVVVNEKESSSSSKREERERERKEEHHRHRMRTSKKRPRPPRVPPRARTRGKDVCLSRVCSLSIVCRRQKSVANFDDVFSSLCAKRRSKINSTQPFTPLMFRVLVVQKRGPLIMESVESFCSY